MKDQFSLFMYCLYFQVLYMCPLQGLSVIEIFDNLKSITNVCKRGYQSLVKFNMIKTFNLSPGSLPPPWFLEHIILKF